MLLAGVGCVPKNNPTPPEPTPSDTVTPQPAPQPEPEPIQGRVVHYVETDEVFANPERGFYAPQAYTSGALGNKTSPKSLLSARRRPFYITLFLQEYFMTDYMESDIAQEFLDRFQSNMQALRDGGGKAILRFAYTNAEPNTKAGSDNRPWDATLPWVLRHIEQLEPYLKQNADVIYCVQAGFVGVWGEWYYTTGFKMNPSSAQDWEPRWQLVDRLLQAVPEDRQLALRMPAYKLRYLAARGFSEEPLTATESHLPTARARLALHNDCFVSSGNDVGTYRTTKDRDFLAEDSKYLAIGGETCAQCAQSKGAHALEEMATYHWSYINRSYHPNVIGDWNRDGSIEDMKRYLGYRFALDSIVLTAEPVAGEELKVQVTLHNSGFAATVNERAVEMVLQHADGTDRHVYKQLADPRYWMAGESVTFQMSAALPKVMSGEYQVLLNLPDPYATLHDNPLFSIRLANEDVWNEETGYNLLTTIQVK